MLRQRVLTTVIGVPVIVVAVLLGNPVFAVLVGAVVARGMWEFYGLAASETVRPYRRTGIVLGLIVFVSAVLEPPLQVAVRATEDGGFTIQASDPSFGAPLVIALIAVVLLSFARAMRREDLAGSLVDWSVTMGGIIYVAFICSFFVLLRQQPDGAKWVLLAAFATFATDIGAYAVGSTLGRHRMSPRISPKKSWEGLAGGVVSAVLVAGIASILLEMPYSVLFGFLLGFPIALLGTFGDLSESLLKRGSGAKDAGSLLPGHGGVLDRIDSLGFVAIFVYIVSIWVNT
jgi:phosphatidate cytidylyltransferase